MKSEEFKNKVEDFKSKIEKVKRDIDASIGIVNNIVNDIRCSYEFDAKRATTIDKSGETGEENRELWDSYRFIFAMFEPGTEKFRGITSRFFVGESDSKVIEDKAKYIPGWEDTKYVLLRIDRVIDDAYDIYKKVWELR